MPDGYKFTPLGSEIKFEFDVQKHKTTLKNSAEEARRQAKEQAKQEWKAREEQEKRIKEYAAEQKRTAARVAKEGDNSPDDLTCKKYGIKPNTPNYGQCRMQLDMARQQAAAAAEQQQRQYEAQQRQYEAELAARKAERQKEKDRQVGMALIGIGTGMMTGKSVGTAVSDMSSPVRPAPPPNTPQTQVITLPNSRPVTCTTVNTVTNCY